MLIGYGMSAGIRPNRIGPSHARVRLNRDGRLTVQLDLTDIGTGIYTILAQIAADALGLPVERIEVQLGDSDFPVTTGSGGSLGAGSAGSALYNACLALRRNIAHFAVQDRQLALNGGDPGRAVFRDGTVAIAGRREDLVQLAARAPAGALEAEGSVAPAEAASRLSQHAYGAYFVEVGVDADTAAIRVRRMLGVFDVGRVLNEKTARSQLIGGMIWGVSAALHEEGIIDARYGRFVNNDLAGYHIPVNADIGEIEAVCDCRGPSSESARKQGDWRAWHLRLRRRRRKRRTQRHRYPRPVISTHAGQAPGGVGSVMHQSALNYLSSPMKYCLRSKHVRLSPVN